MAVVIKEVLELEKMKNELRQDAFNISANQDYTPQEKQSYIGKITDEIYDIDQEIIRLKKQPATIEYKTTDNSMFFIIIGIGLLIFINRTK